MRVDLSKFDNSEYVIGAGLIKRIAWYICNALVFDSWLVPMSAPKRSLLRLFGARVGIGVVIKPRINIKYPWKLKIGDYSWIGEGVWIDNLAEVTIERNVCISQEAKLLTGNHNYRDESFGLITQPICIEEGAWLGAFSAVVPGVVVRRFSILTVSSVAMENTEEGWIYGGIPAQQLRRRFRQAEKQREVA